MYINNINFLIDEQLPVSLAKKLREVGLSAIHLYEIGLGGASDKLVANEVAYRNAVLISKDEDFIEASNLGKISFQIIWIRIGNVSNNNLWQKLEPILPIILSSLENGDKIIEIRSSGFYLNKNK